MTKRKTAGTKSGRKAKTAPKRQRQMGPTKADMKSYLDLVALESQPRGVIRVLPGTKPRLRFSEDERRLILDNWDIAGDLSAKQLKALEKAKQPSLSLSLSDWENFGGWVASTSNHAREGSKLQRRAEALSDRIQELLDRYTDA